MAPTELSQPTNGSAHLDPAGDTFPKLLLRNVERFGDKVAIREKDYGIWQSYSWREYLAQARLIALGLAAVGFKRGDKTAIVGDNRPQLYWAMLATQALGGVPVPLYQDSIEKEMEFIVDHAEARFAIVEDQEQVDKLLQVQARCPQLERIVYDDPRGLKHYEDAGILSLAALQELGRRFDQEHPGYFEREVAQGQADDVAIICYTSGTTGNPKGAMLSFRNLLSMALSLDQVDPKRPDDEFVSFLPLAWIGEQMMSLSTALAKGFTVNFPEEPDTVTENIREIGPNLMFAPPRVWETLTSTVQVKIMDTTPFKRFMYERCMPIGERVADLRFAKKPVPLGLRLLHRLAHVLLLRALKDRLGMSNLRSASTGGAALGPDVFRFFHAMGVPLKQIYGQTEIAGISCIHREDDIAFHTVGKPIPGTEVRIAENGEIQSRSASVFLGYYKNEEATRAALAGGWLQSGDAGYMTDDGHLVVIDRLKDVMKLADGTQFSPQFIENRLKFSPYVKEAVVVGKDRPYLTAMLCIDMGVVGKWAEKNKLSYTTYTDLSAKAEVYDLVQREVDKVNETLPEAARIHKFVLLYKELDADDEELTRTRKVRRVFVEERYREVIAALYGDAPEVRIDTTIKFQDGKVSRIRTTLLVRRLALGRAA
jgi:long-chain acyl-CoA synthetase